MRIVSLDELTNDMVLVKPIYMDADRILLDQGVKNLPKYKDKIQLMGFKYLYVEDKVSQGIEIDEVVSERIRLEGRKMANEVLQKVITNRELDSAGLKKWVEDIINEIFVNKTVVLNMVELKDRDAYLYLHSVNVAVLSLIIGRSFNYSAQHLRYLGVGAILHDIGMILLPESIRQGDYNELDAEEQKIYRTHPQIGYEMLNAVGGVDAFSKQIVWRHHEQLDGRGYPNMVEAAKINELVRIVSVCDAYDELTSMRENGAKMPSYQAIEYLAAEVGSAFDEKIIAQFLKHIAVFPLGSTVVLNDGRRAIVERQNQNFPTRPVLRLLEPEGNPSLDLLKAVNLVIKEVT